MCTMIGPCPELYICIIVLYKYSLKFNYINNKEIKVGSKTKKIVQEVFLCLYYYIITCF